MCQSQTKASLIHSALSSEGRVGMDGADGGVEGTILRWECGGGVAVLVILYTVQRGGAGCYSGATTSKQHPDRQEPASGLRECGHSLPSADMARFRLLEG